MIVIYLCFMYRTTSCWDTTTPGNVRANWVTLGSPSSFTGLRWAGHQCKYPVSNFLSAGHRDFCRLRNSPAGGFSPPPHGRSLSHMLQVQVTPSQGRDSWHQDVLEMLLAWVTKMLTHLKTYFKQTWHTDWDILTLREASFQKWIRVLFYRGFLCSRIVWLIRFYLYIAPF